MADLASNGHQNYVRVLKNMKLKSFWWELVKMRDPRYALEAVEFSIKPHIYKYFQRLNGNVLAIEICNSNLGFFANLNWCLYIINYCKKQDLIPYVEFTSKNYLNSSSGRDWFKSFFLNKAILAAGNTINYSPRHITKIRNLENIKLPKWACELTLADANCIYNEYISIDPAILFSVNNFVIKNFCDKNMLGVHFRGTDKSIEAPRVDWGYLVRTIDNYLKDRPDIEGLFVASDEVGFTEYITERFPELKVISHDDHVRSDGEVAIHSLNSGGDNYLKGVDALVNSLLLSRCSALIRSSSFLSAWASVFNPGIPVILLNKPHKNGLWFPETETIKLSQDQYLPSTSSS